MLALMSLLLLAKTLSRWRFLMERVLDWLVVSVMIPPLTNRTNPTARQIVCSPRHCVVECRRSISSPLPEIVFFWVLPNRQRASLKNPFAGKPSHPPKACHEKKSVVLVVKAGRYPKIMPNQSIVKNVVYRIAHQNEISLATPFFTPTFFLVAVPFFSLIEGNSKPVCHQRRVRLETVHPIPGGSPPRKGVNARLLAYSGLTLLHRYIRVGQELKTTRFRNKQARELRRLWRCVLPPPVFRCVGATLLAVETSDFTADSESRKVGFYLLPGLSSINENSK